MKKTLDPNTGKASFVIKGEAIDINLAGVSKYTLLYLGLYAAHEIMAKRSDPHKAWADIHSGRIARAKEKKTPIIINAIMDAYEMDEAEAVKLHDSLSRSAKMKLRNDSRIKKYLADHETEHHVELSELLPVDPPAAAEPAKASEAEIPPPAPPGPKKRKSRKKRASAKAKSSG